MRPFSYTNCNGETFYLHVLQRGKDRTMHVMRKEDLGATAALPKGYEVRENVQGHVSVRRTRPREFTEAEEELLASQLNTTTPPGLKIFQAATR
jgi:hypothetical protein